MNFEDVYEKYASLLANYCLQAKRNDKVLVRATYLAEPLLKPLYKHLLKAGAHVEFQLSFEDQDRLYYEFSKNDQLDKVSELYTKAVNDFDCILSIGSSFDPHSLKDIPSSKKKRHQLAMAPIKQRFMKRSGKKETFHS